MEGRVLWISDEEDTAKTGRLQGDEVERREAAG
jgi:hypothetical protein